MKRLLLLLPLLLTPAAQAIDYVKCEAMQKAAARVRVTRKQKLTEAGTADVKEQIKEQCGEDQETPLKSGLTCDNGTKFEPDRARMREVMEKVAAIYDMREQKIQADYEAEGCY